jgi:hypothetical protein
VKDTTNAAEAVQTRIHRSLSGAERLGLAFEMSLIARELTLTRLRREHPDWPEFQLKKELLRYAFLPGPFPSSLQ